ncbi:class F sortase [Rhodococcus sp. UNC23MFCrub1.1]|uniref:class F sortase n=1 Tax=Rhodococcus sp. UNC23MFCrub1.1 TaxID=1449068 RepID=UPI000480D133|nr:class F sortase [Rhodococcus sp. UNC23MFCrub1.1]
MSTARTTPRPAASRTRAAAGIVAAVLLLVAVLTGCSTPSSTAPADSAVSAAPQQRTTTGPTGASPTVLGESTPVHLSVPSIGVETDLVGLGLQNDGTMEVPSGGFPAGWYSGSPTPGELGPSILAGHVDWDGAPGVFADLTEVAAGDAVIVTREDGTVASFAVTAVEQYPKDQFPTSSVYGDIDHAGLRLITCGGAFDTDAASYGDNIVVYADAI